RDALRGPVLEHLPELQPLGAGDPAAARGRQAARDRRAGGGLRAARRRRAGGAALGRAALHGRAHALHAQRARAAQGPDGEGPDARGRGLLRRRAARREGEREQRRGGLRGGRRARGRRAARVDPLRAVAPALDRDGRRQGVRPRAAARALPDAVHGRTRRLREAGLPAPRHAQVLLQRGDDRGGRLAPAGHDLDERAAAPGGAGRLPGLVGPRERAPRRPALLDVGRGAQPGRPLSAVCLHRDRHGARAALRPPARATRALAGPEDRMTARFRLLAAALLGLLALPAGVPAQAAPDDAGGASLPRRSAPWSERALTLAGSLPVQDGGRVKPLSTYASFTLLRFNGKRSLPLADGETLEALPWLLDVLFYPEQAADYPVFKVDDVQAVEAAGIDTTGKKKRDHYSFNELAPGFQRLFELAREYHRKDEKDRTTVEQQVFLLATNVDAYFSLQSHFDYARHSQYVGDDAELVAVFGGEEARFSQVVEKVPELMQRQF